MLLLVRLSDFSGPGMLAFGSGSQFFVGNFENGKRVGEGILIDSQTRELERQVWKVGEDELEFPRTTPSEDEDDKELKKKKKKTMLIRLFCLCWAWRQAIDLIQEPMHRKEENDAHDKHDRVMNVSSASQEDNRQCQRQANESKVENVDGPRMSVPRSQHGRGEIQQLLLKRRHADCSNIDPKDKPRRKEWGKAKDTFQKNYNCDFMYLPLALFV